MMWRKLLELSTSSSSLKTSSRRSRVAIRRAMFESLENRQLFAADLALTEFAVADLTDADRTKADVMSAETSSVDLASVDMPPGESMDFVAVKFDEATEVNIEPLSVDSDLSTDAREIAMMTFRSVDATEEVGKDEVPIDDAELGSPVMYMTGAVALEDDVPDVSIQTFGGDVDSTIVLPKDADDPAVTDRESVVNTMAVGSEFETTSLDATSIDELIAEDVNGDGTVTALDMLLVYNALNSYGFIPSSQLTEVSGDSTAAAKWDINRDGYITPLDALLLTNYFNSSGALDTSLNSQILSRAPVSARIRNPADDVVDELVADELADDELVGPMPDVSKEIAPLIADKFSDAILELA